MKRSMVAVALLLAPFSFANAETTDEDMVRVICLGHEKPIHSSHYDRGYELCRKVIPAMDVEWAEEDREANATQRSRDIAKIKIVAKDLGVQP
jgi:hypothetical protein